MSKKQDYATREDWMRVQARLEEAISLIEEKYHKVFAENQELRKQIAQILSGEQYH